MATHPVPGVEDGAGRATASPQKLRPSAIHDRVSPGLVQIVLLLKHLVSFVSEWGNANRTKRLFIRDNAIPLEFRAIHALGTSNSTMDRATRATAIASGDWTVTFTPAASVTWKMNRYESEILALFELCSSHFSYRDLVEMASGLSWIRIALLRVNRQRGSVRLMANTSTGVVALTRNANARQEPIRWWNAADWAVNNHRAEAEQNCIAVARPTIAAGRDWRWMIGWNRTSLYPYLISRLVLLISKYRMDPTGHSQQQANMHPYASVLEAPLVTGVAGAEKPCNLAFICIYSRVIANSLVLK